MYLLTLGEDQYENLKKVSTLLLKTAIVFGSIFVGNRNNFYISTSYKKQLALEKTYKYD